MELTPQDDAQTVDKHSCAWISAEQSFYGNTVLLNKVSDQLLTSVTVASISF